MAATNIEDSRPVRLLSWHAAIALATCVFAQASAACWALAPAGSWAPFGGVFPLGGLPLLIAGVALTGAVLTAPLIGGDASVSALQFLFRSISAALWHAVTCGFFLSVTARLTPLENAGILYAAFWVGLCAWAALLLVRLVPRYFAGVMFFWLIAMPVFAYFLAELFLISPAGRTGWERSTGPEAAFVRGTVYWLLNLSPGTAIAGALDDSVLEGMPPPGAAPGLLVAAVSLALCALLLAPWRWLRAAEPPKVV